MKNKEQINIRNIHCAYFEGQTGLCQVKEFVKCNPINCKLYTMDELSTIVDLQEKLQAKEKECEELKKDCPKRCKLDKYKKALDEIENYIRDNSDFDKNDKLTSSSGAYDILSIINKAKESK